MSLCVYVSVCVCVCVCVCMLYSLWVNWLSSKNLMTSQVLTLRLVCVHNQSTTNINTTGKCPQITTDTNTQREKETRHTQTNTDIETDRNTQMRRHSQEDRHTQREPHKQTNELRPRRTYRRTFCFFFSRKRLCPDFSFFPFTLF